MNSSRLYYPTEQPKVLREIKIKLDDSYFLVRLHDSQVVLPANIPWWGNAGTVLLKTSCRSDQLEQTLVGLHKVDAVKYNQASRLAAQINLTDWLPAYSGDHLNVQLNYTLIKNKSLRQLLDKIAEINLAVKLMPLGWEVSLGVKITEMLGRIYSHLIEEGESQEVFHLETDLNLDVLKCGFQVAADSSQAAKLEQFIITDRRDLILKNQFGHVVEDASFVILEVQALKRLSEVHWRDTAWGMLLLDGKEEALRVRRGGSKEKEKALKAFVEVCYYAGKAANRDHRFIRRHIDEIAAAIESELKRRFFSQESYLNNSQDSLPEAWQRAFNVKTVGQLEAVVDFYHSALADSKVWLTHYNIAEDE